MLLVIISVAMILAIGGLYFSGRSAFRLALGLAVSIFVVGLMVPVFRWDVISVWLSIAFPIAASLMAVFVIATRRQSFIDSWKASGAILKGLIVAIQLVAIWLLFGVWNVTDPDGVPLALEWPLEDGRYYIAHGGNSEVYNHHFKVSAQKYALDITAIDDLGRRASRMFPAGLEDYAIFDRAVLSPCDGDVVLAERAIDDKSQMIFAAGGFVAIDCDGQTVLMAHLREAPNVAAGQRVAAGDVVGRVGNTGNSSEPHLHIHAVDGRTTDIETLLRNGVGVPLTFDDRFLWRNQTVVRPR